MSNEEVLKEAVKKFGAIDQIDMAIEECAELIKALNKLKRLKLVEKNFVPMPHNSMSQKQIFALHEAYGEVADVKIMVRQLEHILQNEEAIELIRERKILRLKSKL